MHILFLIPILILISHMNLSQETRVIVYGIITLFFIPDAILMWRKSPPFVPTFKRDMRIMIELAQIKKGDIVYDPGCGGGGLVFAAASKGAKAIGYEFSFPTFLFTYVRSWFHPGSSIRFGDIWKQNYRDADVILCYLLPEMMVQFHETIWPQLKPGCRVVSNSFRMKNLTEKKSEKGVYLYVK